MCASIDTKIKAIVLSLGSLQLFYKLLRDTVQQQCTKSITVSHKPESWTGRMLAQLTVNLWIVMDYGLSLVFTNMLPVYKRFNLSEIFKPGAHRP